MNKFFSYSTNNLISLTENYDKERLRVIIKYFDDLHNKVGTFKDFKNNYEDITDKNTKLTILKNLYKQKIVNYKPSSKNKDGRLFGTNSCQGVNKIVRHTLCHDRCYDYDIVNCHNVLLQQYCQWNNIDNHNLIYYNNNRDELLQELCDTFNIDRDEAKKIPLSIINGGGHKYFTINGVPPPTWIIDFRNEMKSIHCRIAELEPDRFKKAKRDNKDNPYGTCLNTLLCKMENIILQCMKRYCDNNNINVYTLCFDGFMSDYLDTDELEEFVFNNVGVKIDIVEKKMTYMIDIDEFIKKDMEDEKQKELEKEQKELEAKCQKQIQSLEKKKLLKQDKIDEELKHINDNFSTMSIDIEDCNEIDTVINKLIYEGSDLNAAEVFAKYNNDEMFYTSTFGWVVYNKKTHLWTYDNKKDNLVYPLCKFFTNLFKTKIREIIPNVKNLSDAEKEYLSHLLRMCKYTGTSRFATEVIKQLVNVLQKDNSIMDKFESNGHLFCFSDGKCIDLRDGSFREITKEDYVITTSGYEMPERDEQYVEKAKEILLQIMDNDVDKYNSLVSMCSLSLYGGNINEKWFIQKGDGGNGKGVVGDSIAAVNGNYYGNLSVEQLTCKSTSADKANSELARARFLRHLAATEPETSNDNIKIQVSTIKQLTGGDSITTRFLHKDCFSYVPKFQLHLQCNDDILVSRNDDGFVRRTVRVVYPLLFLEYDNETKEWTYKNKKYSDQDKQPNWRVRDNTLKKQIKDPKLRSGFFYLFLDTFLQNKGRYIQSQSIIDDTQEFVDELNPIKDWFNSNFDIDEDGRHTATDMWEQYKTDTGVTTLYLNAFSRHLNDICPSKMCGGNKKRFKCIKKKILKS